MTQLHFLGPDGALDTFPQMYELQRLREPNDRAYNNVFASAASHAKKRLWVLDLHYHPDGHAGIVHALRRARVPDVRILSGAMPPAKDKPTLHGELRAAWERAWAAGQPTGKSLRIEGKLEWRDRLRKDAFPYPHDRFVVIDEQLWHFGYAAGGSGRCLNAATGPWSATSSRALEFFEEVWLSTS